jgi:hypothetical protein
MSGSTTPPRTEAGGDRFGCWLYLLDKPTIKDCATYFREAGKQAASERPRTLVLSPDELPKPKPKRRKPARAPAQVRSSGTGTTSRVPPLKKTITIKQLNRAGKLKTGTETFSDKTPYLKPDVSLAYRASAGHISTPWFNREHN